MVLDPAEKVPLLIQFLKIVCVKDPGINVVPIPMVILALTVKLLTAVLLFPEDSIKLL